MRNLLIISLALMAIGCSSNNNHSSTVDHNLCDINLNKIDNYRAQFSMTTGEPENTQLKELHEKAKEYKAAGDTKNCIATSEQALSIIAQHSNK
ncbi:hypothetical protein [Entomomonas asaccharolytica]|uniref:Lipoprotein n=1 Tax=Entomomonas asaccharolytica TaxID=2785331 RepID=A0A974RYJ6_9GAMM|nr:hypothetical protein [Entomomonas asaccharolytica]QQP85939.1 hypothetical protein JHT90_01385 [Entomomonas asaccharolytica]